MSKPPVLVVPDNVCPHGVKRTDDLIRFCSGLWPHARFAPRKLAEEDPAWRQLIPYVYITHPEHGVLTYDRTPDHTEQALAGKASVGFGGHIEPQDTIKQSGQDTGWYALHSLIVNCLRREMAEEALLAYADFEFVGFIIDHGDPSEVPLVARVHAGVVFRVQITLERLDFIGCGDEAKRMKWMTLDELKPQMDRRGWSGSEANDDYIWEGWTRQIVQHGLVY